MGLTGIDELVFDFFDFSEYMQVRWLFTIKTFVFFEYMQVLCAFGIKMLILIFWVFAGSELFPIKMFVFFEYMQVWGTWGSPNLHILKEDQHVDTKSAQNLHILKKIKSFDSEKSPNLHILKKIKKIKNQFIYASQSHIESEIFDFFDFFEYMQVWWLFTIETFDFFEYMQVLCTFGINMLIFFEYVQVWWTSSLSNLHFCNQKTKTQNRYTWYVFSCLIIFLMKKTFIKCLNTMNISQQHYQWLLIRSKEELNINNCLTAIAKHIVETQTLHWKQLRNTLDM